MAGRVHNGASLFTSRRERCLWVWTLAVLVAIYGSLGFARTLVGRLPSREVLDAAFFAAFILAITAVVLLAFRRRPSVWDVGILLAVLSVYLMAGLRLGIPAERTHLIEYGILAVLMYEALKERAAHGRRVPLAAMTAIVVVALLGWLDEGVQALLVDRFYDLRDVGFNALAALLAVIARVALARIGRS